MRLTLNVLLSLLIQAKRQGKGKIGNGRMLIMLLQIIADTDHPELSAERNMLRVFSDEPVKSKAYQKIDKQLVKFIPAGKPYPYEKIRFTKFEQSIGNLPVYSQYLLRMHQCCQELLDPDKTEPLIFAILEILRSDPAFAEILYGAQYIPKEALFGTPAHRKKICPAALLLGLLYQTHQIPNGYEEPAALPETPNLLHFHLVYPSGSYRSRIEALIELLNPDAPVALEQSISDTAAKLRMPTDDKVYYPLDLCDVNGNATEIPYRGHLFLYGQGGIGKTTLLYQIHCENTCFMLPLFKYRSCEIPAFQPDRSNWILLQILLKYYYQYTYLTYETCTAEESADTVLRQLHELKKLLTVQPVNSYPDFTLMLDGINEVPPVFHPYLFAEIERICREWSNVRVIVTGRSVPPLACFQLIEVCGISEDALDSLLPEKTEQRTLLKTPLFLNIYKNANQEGVSLNRACLIDAYVRTLIDGVHDSSVQPVLQFFVLYVLPIAANLSAQRQQMFFERADLSDAIGRAVDIYIKDERIYQNLLYPQQITKKSLPLGSDKDELIDYLVSQICLIQADPADRKMLCFSHQYFRDYFAAKYIVNLLTALHTGYENETKPLSELFIKYNLGHLWYPEEMKDIFRLIGELVGDDNNQAEADFIYHDTLLDTVLDWSRRFDTLRVTENIIRTMASVRNNVICGVNFSGTALPLYLPCNIKFSWNGEYACDFIGCQVNLIGLIDGDICCTAKSHDGTKILLALEDQYIILLDLDSGRVLHEFDFSDKMQPWFHFDSAAFSPDSRFVSLLTDHAAMLLNVNTGVVVYQYINQKEQGIIGYAAFSSDAQYWAVRIHGQITLVNLQTGNIIPAEKTLADYNITVPDENNVIYAEKQTVSSLDSEFLKGLYRNLPHYRGCDFTDAVFLSEDTKLWLLYLSAAARQEF